MDKLPPLDEIYLLETLLELLNIPSPTGYTDQVISVLEEKLRAFSDLNLRRTTKGVVVTSWAGALKN